MLLTEYNKQYAQGLSTMGFNYNNILRRDYKMSYRQLDWHMNNLIKRDDIDVIFACIEPDICKLTRAIDNTSNHVHFAWKGRDMSRGLLANSMRIKRSYVWHTWMVDNGMSYFTKHLGKSLSYHNIYT